MIDSKTKFVIIGGAGFIGRAISEALSILTKVIVVDKAENPWLHTSISTTIFKQIEYHQITLLNSNSVRQLIDLIDSDTVVIHLAALIGGVKHFNTFPFDVIEENSRIDTIVFAACALKKPKQIVVFSSSMVYSSAISETPFKETLVNEIPPPVTAYGFSKLQTEKFAEALFEQHGVPYLILRPFNAIGLNDLPGIYSHVVPTFVLRAINKENPFIILGNGQQLRTFVDVDDIASALLFLLQRNISNEAFNIGNSDLMTILDLAKLIWESVNGYKLKEEDIIFKEAPLRDVYYRCPDVSKIMNLGWKPINSLNISIFLIADWIKENLDEFNSRVNEAKRAIVV
jgi:UDP-glucose 4-epimerase